MTTWMIMLIVGAVASLLTSCEVKMKTLEYIKQLTRGVLRNTALSVLRTGVTGHSEEFEQVCTMIDEGLMRLYSRFIIREKHTLIEMQVGVTFYHLRSMYSVTGADRTRVLRPYIMDLPNEPFIEDVIKVLSVFDSKGIQRPLNDQSKPDGLFTPQADTIQSMYPRDLEVLGVAYQASPVSVLVPGASGWRDDTEFYIPDCLVPALSSYVSYMYHQGVGTAESMATAMAQFQMYDEVCREVERMDLVNQSMSCTNVRFSQNGWK